MDQIEKQKKALTVYKSDEIGANKLLHKIIDKSNLYNL